MMKPKGITFSWWMLGFLIVIILGVYTQLACGDSYKIQPLRKPAINDVTASTNANQRIKIFEIVRENPTNGMVVYVPMSGSLTEEFSSVPEFVYCPPGVFKVPGIVIYDGQFLNETNDADLVAYVNAGGVSVLVMSKQRRIQAGQVDTPDPDPEEEDGGEDAPAEPEEPPAPTVYTVNLAWDAYDSATYTNVASLTLYHTFGLSGDYLVAEPGISVSATNTTWKTTVTGTHQFSLRGLKTNGTLTDMSKPATVTIP